MKQIAFLLFIIISVGGIWLISKPKQKTVYEIAPRKTQPQPPLLNKTKERVNSSPTTQPRNNPNTTFDYEKSQQPTAAEEEILEWLKADGCKVENLGSMGYRISWTVRFYTREIPTVIAPDGYSVSIKGPDENGNYLHVRKYNYTWNPLMRMLSDTDFNPVGLTEIKRRRIDTKELR